MSEVIQIRRDEKKIVKPGDVYKVLPKVGQSMAANSKPPSALGSINP